MAKYIIEIETDMVSIKPYLSQDELIRCKDCKYNTTSRKCLNPDSFFLIPADDDFCSRAERRDE